MVHWRGQGEEQREALKVKARTASPRTVQLLISEVVVRLHGLRGLSRVSLLPGSRCSTACRGAVALERSPAYRAARTWLVFYSTTKENVIPRSILLQTTFLR